MAPTIVILQQRPERKGYDYVGSYHLEIKSPTYSQRVMAITEAMEISNSIADHFSDEQQDTQFYSMSSVSDLQLAEYTFDFYAARGMGQRLLAKLEESTKYIFSYIPCFNAYLPQPTDSVPIIHPTDL